LTAPTRSVANRLVLTAPTRSANGHILISLSRSACGPNERASVHQQPAASELVFAEQRPRVGALVLHQVRANRLWHWQSSLREVPNKPLERQPPPPRARIHPVELNPFAATPGAHFLSVEHLARATTRRAQVHHIH